MDEQEAIIEFTKRLTVHANRKSKLYDGSNRKFSPDVALRLATEELGEVATDITRERWHAAIYECIDLAHTAFLLWLAMCQQETAGAE